MQRRAAEESLTDHGKDNSNGRAHVGDAIRHKPGILGFLRQIGFMGATASKRRLHCATGQGAGWSPTRSMKLAGSTWFYASIGCADRVCIAALTYWGIQQNGYKYGVNAVTCVAQADYGDETTAPGFLNSIVIARDRLR